MVGSIDLGIQRLMDAFYKPLTTLRILISIEFFALFLLFPSFYLWSTHRLNYNQGKKTPFHFIVEANKVFKTKFREQPTEAI